MSRCQESQIVIDTSTLEKIVSNPQAILDDEATFWEEEKPQKYTQLWAEAIGRPLDFDAWREQMKEWAALSPGERENHELMRISRAVIEGKEAFLRRALPHLCSYLPPDADIDVTVRLTAFIPPNAFAWQDIMVNMSSDTWKGNVDNTFNLLVHEIFHAGYSYCRGLREEEELEDKALYKMLDNLHGEGFCNYVAYKALPFLPGPDIEDYALLENQEQVVAAFVKLNTAFSMVGESEATLKDNILKLCIRGRAYYVAGSYMCKTIDETAGRDRLIRTLVEGPASFVRFYNSLVDEELRVQAGL